MRGRRNKGIQRWGTKFRDILVLVFTMFLRSFSARDVVKSTEKVENALRSKSKSVRRCIDHPQKRKVLYLSINRL